MNPNPLQPHPPAITTADPDSFAAFTFRERLPKMIDQIVEKNVCSGSEAAALQALKRRITSGSVEDCLTAHPHLPDQLAAAEYSTWSREISRQAGRSWLDIPWYFAESLFYLEVLLAWGYYCRDSPRFSTDPFRPFKEEELRRPGGALDLADRIAAETAKISSPRNSLPVLLQFCLWANRLDLSYSQVLERYRNRSEIEANRLLVDHTEATVERLLRARRVDLILDNSASELIADLHLANLLLEAAEDTKVVLHCKKAPFYVSDATIEDVQATIDTLKHDRRPNLRRLGQGLSLCCGRGSLVLRDHHFWTGPLHFPDFPADLRRELAMSDLVVLKGDLNYRRLLADRRWAPSTDMALLVRYFPAALVTLRTTKSELIVDLALETVEVLNRDDPNWLVQGGYGIIRYWDPRYGSEARRSSSPLSR